MTAALIAPAAGLLDTLAEQALDPMLTLLQALRGDPRPGKIDLGIGVYRTGDGRTPVMAAVKQAEQILVDTQASKDYVAAEGDARFLALLAPMVLGAARPKDDNVIGLQTPGGTGALRLALSLLFRANPEARVWLGTPTWSNHISLVKAAGLTIQPHPFFDKATQTIEFDAMMAALEDARPSDCLLLHAGCHNPTGAGFTADQWRAIAQLAGRKGILPLIDMAYQGLGRGLEEDAEPMRGLLDQVPEALVAVSCSKNFGLYRDRVGALWTKAGSASAAHRARGNLILSARSMWSMPPDHGSAIIRTILESDVLTALWRGELDTMRDRINAMRAGLAAALPQLAPVARQTGMFSLLPITRENAVRLRIDHGIYMLETGRINIAGLNAATLPVFAEALAGGLM